MQNLLAFGLLTTSISAQTTLQQYVDCEPDLDTNPALWTLVAIENVADAATCETELDKASAAQPDLSPYTICAGFKRYNGINYCGYYYALTSEGPRDIREGKNVKEGADMWTAYYIDSKTPEAKLAGIPIYAKEESAV